ncbi:unnamed protein product, partial [marine sediment metagenome]
MHSHRAELEVLIIKNKLEKIIAKMLVAIGSTQKSLVNRPNNDSRCHSVQPITLVAT